MFVPYEIDVPSISSTSTFVHPLQVPIYAPSYHNGPPLISQSRSKGTSRPPFLIQPLADRVAFPSDVSGLQNTYYARVLLGATIATTDFKGAYTSLKCDMMQYYRTTVIEVKAKDYKESFEKVRDELRLEKQAKTEEDQKRLLEEEFDVRFLTDYAQQDHPKGWSVFRIYE
ncbi:hypothetical protein PS1_034328 [Malus domestica]